MNWSRLAIPICLLCLVLQTTAADALIMVGKGNAPVSDSGWPVGALDVANQKTRVAWYEGPPFGGGQWVFQYRGNTADLKSAVKLFSAIRAPSVIIVLHDGGPQASPFLKDDKDPKADATYDWSFAVWVPANWHRLYNDPRSTFLSDHPNFRKPVDAPRLDVYLSAKLDWKQIDVPRGVTVIDRRSTGDKAADAAAATLAGDVYDMATGKGIAGAEVSVEGQKDPAAAPAFSDADGRFELRNLPGGGRTRIVVAAPGYASRVVSREQLEEGSSARATIELCLAADLTGTVNDADGKPVAGLVVRMPHVMGLDGRGYATPTAFETKTDDKGQFTLKGLPKGYAQIWVQGKGWFQVDSMKLLAIPPDREPTLKLQVVATGGIKGKVVDAKGEPPKDGNINVNPPGDPIGKWGGSMQLKPDGTFEFDAVPPGPYTIGTQPQYPGSKPDASAQQITVTSGKTTEVTLTLPPPPVRVRDRK